MTKLEMLNIRKRYKTGGTEVEVLKGISLRFRDSEFVSILGQSGCGKTTLLNIIGGLDRYNEGDLFLNKKSTKTFKAADWDAYRNNSIGFVFQNYNLIGHQSVLHNVEIALTLSGIGAEERKKRAIKALEAVQLADHINKKPNQLSGGQMQRVAIARALVNDPDIILADEPTGALDSQTSVQVMDILRTISKEKLVIMVTHNKELAEEYSTRIISLLDGEVRSDSNEYVEEQKEVKANNEKLSLKKTAMSLGTALRLSFKNLLTKKGRTITTSFAGSIGIIGVSLVLALSSGLSNYMNKMQSDTLAGMPLTIRSGKVEVLSMVVNIGDDNGELKEFPQGSELYSYDRQANAEVKENIISEEFVEHINTLAEKLPDSVNNIQITSGISMNVLSKYNDKIVSFPTDLSMLQLDVLESGFSEPNLNTYWQALPNNDDFILSQYDLIGEGSRLPKNDNEIVLVVDKYNRIDKDLLERIGIDTVDGNYDFSNFIGQSFLKVIFNDSFYEEINDVYSPQNSTNYEEIFNADGTGVPLTVTGILREKPDIPSPYLNHGFAYTQQLVDMIAANAEQSSIVKSSISNTDIDVTTGFPFINDEQKESFLRRIGVETSPAEISIFPVNFEEKEKIINYIDEYNENKSAADKIEYTDLAEFIVSATGKLLNSVTAVLVAFAAISLIVSSIMIGIITYVSVIERTKEIGILRSVGARKKDISRVFNAETLIIGFCAGTIGVLITYLLQIPINKVVEDLTEVSSIASLNIVHGILLVVGSMALTFIAGLLPARSASKKDPVIALRSE